MLRDPLKLKALQKGLAQLCEEGATQLFRPAIDSKGLITSSDGHYDEAEYQRQLKFGAPSQP